MFSQSFLALPPQGAGANVAIEPDRANRASAVSGSQFRVREFIDAVEGLGKSLDEVQERRTGDSVLRTYGIGAQILRDLGLSKIRVLSAPKQMHAISGFDLEITEYV